MKKILISGGIAAFLMGCTAVPVPVSVLPMFPGLLPQAPPIVRPTAYTAEPEAAVLVTPTPVAAAPRVVTPPVLTVAGQPPAIAPDATVPTAAPVAVSPAGLQPQNLGAVAERIFRNETGGDDRRLINWNGQDNFVELGIGHLVWYPANKRGRFTETFPSYLKYVQANRIPLPNWLEGRPSQGGPWADRAAFERAQNDQQMVEMRNFLRKTLNLQANFMLGHLRQTLPAMVQQLPPAERQRVLNNFQVMEKTPGGWYPVLDYTQFQGDGANPNDRYRGMGWGLVQVLQAMENVSPGPSALAEFMRAADDTLVRRVANAPADRREARQLASWQERLRTYKPGGNSVASR